MFVVEVDVPNENPGEEGVVGTPTVSAGVRFVFDLMNMNFCLLCTVSVEDEQNKTQGHKIVGR